MHILGVDIAKKKFDVILLIGDKTKHKEFSNSASGFKSFCNWMIAKEIVKAHICMEATGIYSKALATYLYDKGYMVSVVNPAKIKNFAKSSLCRNKTDKLDAKIIANFCKALNPSAWQPECDHIEYLRALVLRLDDLNGTIRQELNRFETAHASIKANVKKTIVYLEKQAIEIKKQIINLINKHPDLKTKSDLLKSIPGVSDKTIARILAFIGNPEKFETAKQIAAFVGLSPRNCKSGSSVHGKTKICRNGNANLRAALYMPAITAKKYNPAIKAFCARLSANGKCNMAIICAAMRKLLHIIYGVLKSGKAFDYRLAMSS